jgi:alpha-L-arabinofuranosidase
MRIANGHPDPFNLKFMEIGNENYNSTGTADQSDHYAERYYQFYQAIKAKYPYMTLIGNVKAWGTDDPVWWNSYPVEMVDEHYYRSPSWFISKYDKYDTYSRTSYKVYSGEYAVTSNYGTTGNLNAAIGEAVYMEGMENNSDVCRMASYAPIFVNENNQNWRPDMIRFNSGKSFGTPSYYVQKLFSNNVGTQNVKWTETGNSTSLAGKIGLGTWSTSATFDDVSVTASDGTTLLADDFSASTNKWTTGTGTWATADGAYAQSSTSVNGATAVYDLNLQGKYTYHLKATKTGGAEGFLIIFDYRDASNYLWWNLGGWGNTQHAVEQCVAGSKTTLASTAGSLVTGQTYDIKIVVDGAHIQCYLDDALVHDFTIAQQRSVYVASSINDATGEMFVKLVNPNATEAPTTINITNATVGSASATVLTSADGGDENTMSAPNTVIPEEASVTADGNKLTYTAPAYSVNIVKLAVSDVKVNEPDTVSTLPTPVVKYGFEGQQPADDGSLYEGTLQGEASIVPFSDGNHALYTGPLTGKGYLDLGTAMPKSVLAKLTGDYSISVDLMSGTANNLGSYCWAYAFANGTSQYLGLVNGAGNTNWYYETKGTSSENVESKTGISTMAWHNFTYVQKDSKGSIYVDGVLAASAATSFEPSDIASAIQGAYLGLSPFTADAVMENTYFDNFQIFGSALSAAQVSRLASTAGSLATGVANSEAAAADRAEISDLLLKFNYLHTTTTLPATATNGAAITWSLTPIAEGYVSLSTDGTPTLTVQKLATSDAVEAATLKASIVYSNGEKETLTQIVKVAPDDNRYGYLYCFMNSGTEITNFALGKKENLGKTFNVLLGGGEAFDTYNLAQIEHGMRDAYMTRGEGSDGYFIVTTDMKEHASGVWKNYGIDLLRSTDMIHWEGTTFDFRKGTSIFSDASATDAAYTSDAQYANIYRVWAPQVFWDSKAGKYLVYYSILSSNTGDAYDKVYYSYTDANFKTLTQPRLFFDAGRSVIDADLQYNPYDGLYHLLFKKEGASGGERGIYEATSPTLLGGTWTEILHITNEGSNQVEAPSSIRRINEDGYNFYYMRYSGGNAYKCCTADHLGLNISASATLGGDCSAQHGSVLTITKTEYDVLQAWSDVRMLLPTIEGMQKQAQSDIFKAAIDQAHAALALTDLTALSTALPAAYEALSSAITAYQQAELDKANNGQAADLTFKITNADFSNGSTGWKGTTFTNADGNVAEQYSKTFDTYQILTDMPAGIYKLTCQGFYRYGSIAVAYAAHTAGTEKLLAQLYMGDQSTSFVSLYSTDAYTYSPYTYPDGVGTANTAFNTDSLYTGNAVSYTLTAKGDLRIGARKTVAQASDWNCFDNFHLSYLGSTDGVNVMHATVAPVDVYTLDGICLRHGVSPSKATKGLLPGIYIVGGEKVTVK